MKARAFPPFAKSLVERLQRADEHLQEHRMAWIDALPLKAVKWMAQSYPDARVRKAAFDRLGVYMGEGTYANVGMTAIGSATKGYFAVIGARVSIGPNLTLIGESMPNNSQALQAEPYVKERLMQAEPIVIKDDVWLGANITVLPGVTIERGCVIGAMSLLTKSTQPFGVYAGIPARRIRDLQPF